MTADSPAMTNPIDFLLSLRQVREYLDRPVPEEVIGDVLRVARWSGSARNRQPWEFVIIEDPDTLRRIATADGYAKHVAGAPVGIVIVLKNEIATQESYDEGRVSERIMLAALAHGVGAGIGWFSAEGETTVKELLKVPNDRKVRSIIGLGYPDEDTRRVRQKPAQVRKPLAEIVHRERYGG